MPLPNRPSTPTAGRLCLAAGRALCLGTMLTAAALAADVRERTRPADGAGTAVTAEQAGDITLTLTEVALRPIQRWIRSSGTLNPAGDTLTVRLSAADAQAIRIGQRLRAFSLNRRSQMHQGRVTAITAQAGTLLVQARFVGDVEAGAARLFVVEMVVEQAPMLSVPNVAIIDDGPQRVVYVQRPGAELARQPIRTGLEGELYSQVVEGLSAGDRVVSIGSFFVDAEQKLSAAGAAAMFGICTTTPGLDFAALQSSGLSRKSRLAGYQAQVSELIGRQK